MLLSPVAERDRENKNGGQWFENVDQARKMNKLAKQNEEDCQKNKNADDAIGADCEHENATL